MARFRFRGREFESVDADHATFGEIAHCERLLKVKLQDWGALEAIRAMYFVSVRRVDAAMLSWSAMDDLSKSDFEDVDDPDGEAGEGESDPTRPEGSTTSDAGTGAP